jgi:hypothetical protein
MFLNERSTRLLSRRRLYIIIFPIVAKCLLLLSFLILSNILPVASELVIVVEASLVIPIVVIKCGLAVGVRV